MPIDVDTIDLTHVQDVTDIEPTPTLAVSDDAHHIGPLGHEGKRLMLELLDATDEEEPVGTRVFGRLGLPYAHARWHEFDLYWAEGGSDAVVKALASWNAAHSLGR